jgi:outer membrane usher protein
MPKRHLPTFQASAIGIASCFKAVAFGWSFIAMLNPPCARADPASAELFLDVTLNGVSRHLIGHFTRNGDGTIGASVKELNQIGLRTPMAPDDRFVPLATLPRVTYAVDEQKQTIRLQAAMSALATNEYDLSPLRGSLAPDGLPQQRLGAVLNYDLYAASTRDVGTNTTTFNGASASLEARVFSPLGTLSQSGIVGDTTVSSEMTGTRLDSTLTYVDPNRERVYRGGDVISGGLAWTRPIRLGGFQVEKDFGLRPDLVTLPLPSASGSAAVPSALNVFVNGVQTYSQQVPTGPFQLNNIPAVTGAGNASIVLRDASGKEIQQDVPFFASAKLLRPGLYDYSVEAGAARLNYGAASFDYDSRVAASASGRVGLTDWLTVEGHTETTDRLGNIGAGFDLRTGAFGVLSAAGAVSTQDTNRGSLAYGSYQFQVWGLTFSTDSQHTFGAYRDLAAVTAPLQSVGTHLVAVPQTSTSQYLGVNGYFNFGSVLPPREVDRASVGIPLGRTGASVNVAFTNYVDADDVHSRIASLSYSAQLPMRGSFFATALHDFGDSKNTSILVGVSFPIGADVIAGTSVQAGQGGTRVTTQASKPIGLEPGSYGWNISDAEGGDAYRSAGAGYRTNYGLVGAQVNQVDRGASASAQASGSVVMMSGSDVHFGQRIDDGFAVVKAGAPNVPVTVENRPVGTTGSDGELLVTGLRSYGDNKIAIDGSSLPVNASIQRTKANASPSNRGGTLVDFGVDVSAKSVIVHFVDRQGKDIPPGTEGTVDTTHFVVGYGGEAYLTSLASRSDVVLKLATEDCRATVKIDPSKLRQRVGPVPCQ